VRIESHDDWQVIERRSLSEDHGPTQPADIGDRAEAIGQSELAGDNTHREDVVTRAEALLIIMVVV
jgi:hypothetical protein